MATRSSQIEEERRTVMATPSPSTPRFLDWTQEDQPAEETPEGKNVELPTFPTPPTPLADTENKMADRPTLFTDKTPSPSETWKTFRFHKGDAGPRRPGFNPEQRMPNQVLARDSTGVRSLVGLPDQERYQHRLATTHPAPGAATKRSADTEIDARIRRDTATRHTHHIDAQEDEPRSLTSIDAKDIGKSDARRIANTHHDPANTGEGDTRRLAAAKAFTLPDT
ncbi:hypothetical protein ACJJTC_003323 [Scirpophaga incertulas]